MEGQNNGGRRYRSQAADNSMSDEVPEQGGMEGSEVEQDAILDSEVEDERLPSDGEAPDEEESDGEELLGDNMMDDYRAIPNLDQYRVDPEAEVESASLSIGARLGAEREMQERDRMEGRAVRDDRRLPAALQMATGEDDEEIGHQQKRRRILAEAAAASRAGHTDGMSKQSGLADDGDPNFDIENYRGPLREWVLLDRPRRELRRRFNLFLRETKDQKSGSPLYMESIRAMCSNNHQSIVVSYRHLSSADPVLAVWVADAPVEMLSIFDDVAKQVALSLFPSYERIHPDIYVRIADLPIVDNLRDIRHIHLNCLVKVAGVVTRRTGVFPHMKIVKLDCQRCGAVQVPTGVAGARPEKAVSQCSECGSRGPFKVNAEQTVFDNFQRMTIQESPGSVPAGRLPRQKDVMITADLIDCARPGDAVEVTGVYTHCPDISLNIKNGFPVFSTVIRANYVRKMDESDVTEDLTDDEIFELRKLSQDPKIADRIIASMAPSIYGHKDIKTAIALSLFGGQAKEVGEKHRIRGDINVLLLGDPGTAKSQFLKYVEKTANRAVYTTGKGASAVGLTAAVRKDAVSGEWVLEGGALVLADRGTCLIDEFDKMNDQDRTSIHEAMEQQTISISKAGIVTTLQARCSVIAAANPVKGRYDSSVSFSENVDLTEPILSRFDVLCVVRDAVDPLVDENLARFVVNSHSSSHPSESRTSKLAEANEAPVMSETNVELIPQDLLRKYLIFARRTASPRFGNVDHEKISRLYIDLRRESLSSGGMPIALRHLESIVRMSEARARMHLRSYVRDDDVNVAISVMLESFFQSQKFSVMRGLKRKFFKYLTYYRNDFELLFYLVSRLVRDYLTSHGTVTHDSGEVNVEIDLADFNARAREMGITNTGEFLSSKAFKDRGFSVNQDMRRILKVL
ncbi:hypothetical protein NDN08_004116 [Rhodosorus marinus]|uniref:DNA replication licensing factor MCM2 n=1 Tax=Rhodosorus marinus TaxID=101924 RepID=A0AAV8UL62_9RHOD|nr:hypothetical protein NDN08_004116 [Rhodosorus marinus]